MRLKKKVTARWRICWIWRQKPSFIEINQSPRIPQLWPLLSLVPLGKLLHISGHQFPQMQQETSKVTPLLSSLQNLRDSRALRRCFIQQLARCPLSPCHGSVCLQTNLQPKFASLKFLPLPLTLSFLIHYFGAQLQSSFLRFLQPCTEHSTQWSMREVWPNMAAALSCLHFP